MSEWFSEEELDRIARFAESPGHSRDPTMLLPEEESVGDEDDDEIADGERGDAVNNAAEGGNEAEGATSGRSDRGASNGDAAANQ